MTAREVEQLIEVLRRHSKESPTREVESTEQFVVSIMTNNYFIVRIILFSPIGNARSDVTSGSGKNSSSGSKSLFQVIGSDDEDTDPFEEDNKLE